MEFLVYVQLYEGEKGPKNEYATSLTNTYPWIQQLWTQMKQFYTFPMVSTTLPFAAIKRRPVTAASKSRITAPVPWAMFNIRIK